MTTSANSKPLDKCSCFMGQPVRMHLRHTPQKQPLEKLEKPRQKHMNSICTAIFIFLAPHLCLPHCRSVNGSILLGTHSSTSQLLGNLHEPPKSVVTVRPRSGSLCAWDLAHSHFPLKRYWLNIVAASSAGNPRLRRTAAKSGVDVRAIEYTHNSHPLLNCIGTPDFLE